MGRPPRISANRRQAEPLWRTHRRPPPRRSGFRSTLRNRFFQRLWLAQLLSQTVQNATNYGSIVLLAQVSHSSTAVGGVIIAFSLPAVLFGVPAGVLVDRLDKRLILWVSNGLRAVASFGFVVAILSNSHDYLLIYLLTFLISVIGQFFGPAEGTAIPLLVGEGDLVPALSLFNVTFSVSQALGFIILGPLIVLGMPTISFPIGTAVLTLTSIHWLFLFIGCIYLVCAFLTWSIPRDKLIGARNPNGQPTGQRIGNVWHGVVEAWTFVRHNRPLLIAVLQLTLGGSVITIISNDRAQLQRSVHAPPGGAGGHRLRASGAGPDLRFGADAAHHRAAGTENLGGRGRRRGERLHRLADAMPLVRRPHGPRELA